MTLNIDTSRREFLARDGMRSRDLSGCHERGDLVLQQHVTDRRQSGTGPGMEWNGME